MAADRLTGRMFATRSEVIATHGMVCASQPLAAQAGIDILKKGGTAVDAAIAVNACLGLMEPSGSGIGGDLFAIVWDAKTRKLHGINASGPAPKGLSLQYFREKHITVMPAYGPLPVTVPGCVDGWCELHRKFGRLPLGTVLEPAAAYAENGFPLSELIASYWRRAVNIFKEFPAFQKLYAPGRRIPGKGDIFRNPELAATLRLIGKGGRQAFYEGPVAQRIVACLKQAGGFFTAADLADFHSEWVEPVSVRYRGYDVWELPPNGQGLAVLQMLKILEKFDLRAMGHNSADYLHTLIEAKKIVFEDRARYYADPRFATIPLAGLLSDEYAATRRALIDPKRSQSKIPAGEPPAHGDTVYLTVADQYGNVVSLIQSNYMGFGSGLVPEGLGFTLHNRGNLFSLEEGHANALAPGKRPFHTIIPAFVTQDGRPVFSFGVMGGDIQPQGHVQILLNIIDFAMNIQEAGDAPRFRHLGSTEPNGETVLTDGGTVFLESGIEPEVIRTLLQRGHKIAKSASEFGGYQGIWIDAVRGILIGASESRKDGCAVGY